MRRGGREWNETTMGLRGQSVVDEGREVNGI